MPGPLVGAAPIPKSRIESLSDLIFGLALSIGALALFATPPAGTGGSPQSVVVNDVVEFLYTFILLMTVWIRYTTVATLLPMESRRAFQLNIVLLFLVALEPYLFNKVSSVTGNLTTDPYGQFVTTLYALDLGGLLAILSAFDYLALRPGAIHATDAQLRLLRSHRLGQTLSAACFLVSALPFVVTVQVLGVNARIVLWIAPLLLMGVWRRGSALQAWLRARSRSSISRTAPPTGGGGPPDRPR